MKTIYDYTVTAADGTAVPLASFKGQVVLIVNTATKCGFATQFAGLEKLYQEHKASGFTVLGFPSDQFKQEPVSNGDMAGLCQRNFGVTFPLFARLDVNGPQADPLYTFLKQQKGGVLGGSIKWNFTKFLVGRDGTVIKRYAPATEPAAIAADIAAALQQDQ